jgi:hypothetical protein
MNAVPGSIELTVAHWTYLVGVLAIIVTMIYRANVVVPAIVSTFAVALAWSGGLIASLESVFNASLVAARELFNIFLVIALMTAVLNALRHLRSDIRMVDPFRRLMVNGHVAYWALAFITYLISLFFWPTPAVPLVGAVLLPAAILAGLPPMGAAMAIAIAGQGMALSSDYVIRVAPGISAKAAGAAVSMNVVADRALVLSLITGVVALVLGHLALRRTIRQPSAQHLVQWARSGTGGVQTVSGESSAAEPLARGSHDKPSLAGAVPHETLLDQSAVSAELHGLPPHLDRWSKVFAVIAPLVFLGIMVAMVLPRLVEGLPEIKGGDAAALVGGGATVLLIFATLAGTGRRFLDATADNITDGFVFAFRAMGSMLPIAGFFFVGAPDTAGAILGLAPGTTAPNLLFDLVQTAQGWIPHNHFLVALSVLLVGMITGIDGSGFAGLPLTGSLSGALGPTVGIDPATLCAVGQMGAVWTGGGTLIAWSSLIAVTGFARVPVLDAVRALFWPVILGLLAATIAAVLLW